jgi:3-phosphoshikimate 1-carboxyvinyltransferase
MPLLALASCFARGESRFEGLGELRLKESDRLAAIEALLDGLGVPHELDGDTLTVRGGGGTRPCLVEARGDHRLAMLGAVASLVVPGLEAPRDSSVAVSWPSFYDALHGLTR